MKKKSPGRIPYSEKSDRNPLYCNLSALNRNDLIYCKVPYSLWMVKPFNISDVASSIEATRLDGSSLTYPKEKQLATYKRFYNNILTPTVYCIASYPNDLRAKYVAAILMAQAIKEYQKVLTDVDYTMPEWHILTGSYKDRWRDRTAKSGLPSLIVLNNVDETSTNVKLEKLRDVLEMYDNIPRIVVIGGIDPITFFNKIRYKLNGALYLIPNIEKMQKNI